MKEKHVWGEIEHRRQPGKKRRRRSHLLRLLLRMSECHLE